MSDEQTSITPFGHGTLKCGQCHHDCFFRNAIVGRLCQLPAGFPAGEVPSGAILADGNSDPVPDARTQARFTACRLALPAPQLD